MKAADQKGFDGIIASVDGIQFKGENLRDTVTISNPSREITLQDRDRVMDQATSACKLAKEETVLHKSSQMFHIKGQRGIKNPVGMIGETLEAEVRIIVAPTPVIENINRALYLSGLGGAKLCYSPIATAKAILSREDAENGAVIVDIGDQLTHLGVFMNEALLHSAVIPIGGMHFTEDMEIYKHLGGIGVAERIKRLFGTVMPDQVPPEEMIDLEDEWRQVSRRELAEVLHYRAVELINMVLAEIGRSGIADKRGSEAPVILGGVHLVGGGALLLHLPILAQNYIRASRVVLGKASGVKALPQVVANPFYTNAIGAVKALNASLNESMSKSSRRNAFGGKLITTAIGRLKKWL
jgi:cell division protein FtsA